MNKIKAIIAGADGTLVNTLYLIRHGQYEAAVEYMVERGIARHDIPGYEDYESFINKSVGGTTRDTFEKTIHLLFGERHAEHLKAISFDELDRRLGPIQDRLAPLYIHPFHGLTEMLTWMGKQQLPLGIFTSASRYQIVRNLGTALPALGYADLFANVRVSEDEKMNALIERTKAVYGLPKFSIVTSNDVKATKPDPEGLLKAVQELGLKPNEVIMVGDLDVDIIAAKKAGVTAVGIAHGFGTPADLQAAGAVRVVDDLNELVATVEKHNSGEQMF